MTGTIAAWNGVVNYPYILQTVGTIGTIMGEWETRSPKADTINAVKLTKSNLLVIAKGMLRKGAPRVVPQEDYITYGDVTFVVGDWIVMEYSYTQHVDVYRVADVSECVKYDLR